MCGLPDQALIYRLKDHNVSIFDTFDYEEFMMYAFVIFDELDKGSFEAKKAPATHRGDGGNASVPEVVLPVKEGKEKEGKEKDREKEKDDACVVS
jgi:hypothetical protein